MFYTNVSPLPMLDKGVTSEYSTIFKQPISKFDTSYKIIIIPDGLKNLHKRIGGHYDPVNKFIVSCSITMKC